MRIVRTEVG